MQDGVVKLAVSSWMAERTSGAKAPLVRSLYGTAEAVPLKEAGLSEQLAEWEHFSRSNGRLKHREGE